MRKNFMIKRTDGFTLIELLVVTAISGVLIALGVGVAQGSFKKAHSTKCLSSLRQIGLAVHLYAGENDGRLPNTSHAGVDLSWVATLSGYLSTNFIGRCPVNPKSSDPVTYAWNDLLAGTDGVGVKVPLCREPSSTLAVAETADSYSSEHFHFAGSRTRVTFNQFKSAVGVNRHGQTANYLFVDGHTESLTVNEVKNRLSAAAGTFLEP